MIRIVVVLLVVFCIYYCNCACDRKEDEILSVVVMFRHGDKTPKAEYFEVYPHNPWSNPKLWNYTDLGGITHRGKLRAYERGKWLRRRYGHFIPEHYSSRNMIVNASDSDRVLMSTQLLLNGLMPPKGRDLWNSEVAWQPIPVHTRPDHEDMVLAQKAPCHRFQKLLTHKFSQQTHSFVDLQHLSKYTGQEITSLEQIYKLYKLLRIIEENGMVLPGWAVHILPKLKEKIDLFCTTYASTDDMQRFKAGPFFHVLLTQFDGILWKSPTAPKVRLLGGHSRSISNVLMVFDAYTEQPPYVATLMFELKKNCNGNVIVDIYYQTTGFGKPREIMKGMPYSVFKQRYKHVALDPKTWDYECRGWFWWLGF